jgi:hypothetical protein
VRNNELKFVPVRRRIFQAHMIGDFAIASLDDLLKEDAVRLAAGKGVPNPSSLPNSSLSSHPSYPLPPVALNPHGDAFGPKQVAAMIDRQPWRR